MATLNALKPSARLSIANPQSKSTAVFGPGIAALCNGVRELGSLNAAAKSMKMAYSKAWRIVKETESALGFKLLARDGARGSSLTKRGLRLLNAYDALDEQIDSKLQELYQQLLASEG